MEGFEYETKIHDGMSDPVERQIAALTKLTHAITSVEGKLGELGKAENDAGKHAEKAGHGAKHAEGFFSEFGASLIPEIAVAELAAEAIKKLGEVVLDLGVEGARFALEAADFKEDTTAAYQTLYDSAEEGERAFTNIQATAIAFHVKVEEAGAMAQELITLGIEDQDSLANVINSVSNLRRVGLEGGAEKLKRIIEQSAAVGHFQLPKKLAGLGVRLDDIVNELAVSMHKTPETIKQELKAGKIETEQGIAAITKVINEGKIGQIAAKKFDLADLQTDWHNFWVKLFEDVDAEPLMNALRGFVGIFDSSTASGKTMHDTIVEAFNEIMRVGGEVIDWATIFALKITLGFEEGKLAAKPLREELAKMGFTVGGLGDVGDALRAIAKYGTEAAIAVAYLGAQLGRAVGWLVDMNVEGLKEIASLFGGGKGGGGGAVGTAPAHAEGGRVLQPAAGEVFASVAPGETIVPAGYSLRTPTLDVAGGGGGRGDIHVDWSGDINVHDAHDKEEFKSIVSEELADMFERIRDESGAGKAA